MQKLTAIYNELGVEKTLIDLSNQKIEIPYLDTYNNPDQYWYPHPPVLIPLFIGHGASYKGILCHFFSPRKRSYIEYELEWGFMLEFARNVDQIYAQMVLDMDMVAEGLDDKILKFCDDVKFKESGEVDIFADKYGNVISDYNKLIHLVENTPLTYLEDITSYTGNYPSSETVLNEKQVYNACSFEITNINFLRNIPNLPRWLITGNPQKDLFDELINNDDLKGAWLTLNSTGWLLKDVAKGLEKLKSKTDDNLFHLVADNWIIGWQNSSFPEGSY
ncbi:hypothetical protein ABIB40_003654 [Pedobacter sp. UYP30]|uniref:hypothetical protein n=1 Tax=Pedobacter sp. UYP30 TaxID=1756400 RepID=UPI003393F24F